MVFDKNQLFRKSLYASHVNLGKDALTALLLNEHLMNGLFDPRSNDPIESTVAELTELTNLDLSQANVVTTECADGTHNCIADATCIQVRLPNFAHRLYK